MTTAMITGAERHQRLSAALGEAEATYDALKARAAAIQSDANDALSVADMERYGKLADSLDTLRGELERQSVRIQDITRQQDAANYERVREEHVALLAEHEKGQAVAEQEVQRFAAEIVPLVEALRDVIRNGKAAENQVAAHRGQVHGLKMRLGEIRNGELLVATYRPIVELLLRNPALDELNAYGVR